MEQNVFLRLAQERYTTKHYSGREIPREQMASLLEILRLTPTSVNCQAWHFFTAHTPEARAKLLPALPEFNRDRVTEASDVIVFTVPTKLDDAHFERVLAKEAADGRFDAAAIASGFDRQVLSVRSDAVARYCSGPDRGEIWAREQVSIALGFLLFAAAGMGIDATPLGGMEFDKVDEILGLPAQGRRAVIGCAIGRRAADDSNARRPKSRLPFDEVVTIL